MSPPGKPKDEQMVNLTLFHLGEETKWRLRELAARWRLSDSEMVTVCIEEYWMTALLMSPEKIEAEIGRVREKYEGKGRIRVYPEGSEGGSGGLEQERTIVDDKREK